jgi:hypothetical protein
MYLQSIVIPVAISSCRRSSIKFGSRTYSPSSFAHAQGLRIRTFGVARIGNGPILLQIEQNVSTCCRVLVCQAVPAVHDAWVVGVSYDGLRMNNDLVGRRLSRFPVHYVSQLFLKRGKVSLARLLTWHFGAFPDQKNL